MNDTACLVARPVVLLAAVLWAMLLVAALSSCTTTGSPLPPPRAPDAVKVLVPVPTPCAVEQVEASTLPSAGGVPNDIFEAVKRVLADRAVLLGDREKLVAANSDPCPEVKH